MPNANPAGLAQSFLVQRRGNYRSDITAKRELCGSLEVLIRGKAHFGTNARAAQTLDVDIGQIDEINRSGMGAGISKVVNGTHFQGSANDANRGLHRALFTDDERSRLLVDVHVCERLGDDLRTDTARV